MSDLTVAATGSTDTTIWHDPPTLTQEQLAITDWPLLSAILHGRGITTRAEATAFLQAATAPLADPYL